MNMGTLLHELLHVLGLFHEHNRPDRDEFVIINYENILEDAKQNFVTLSWKEFGGVHAFRYFDYDSIMMYGEMAFSKNNNPTMVPRYGYILDPAYKNSLSSSDIETLRLMYSAR